MTTISQIASQIQVTQEALNRVKQLIQEAGNHNLKLRIYITGGGCSGFQYGFCFDEVAQPDDIHVAVSDILILIDPLSMMYLSDAELHYTEGLYGSHFSVRNPHAQTTCSCGASFSVADQPADTLE